MDISVIKTCSLPREVLFKAIEQSLLDDYVQNTKKKATVADLKPGLSYIKHFGKNDQNSTKVTLVEFKHPYHYEALFSSNRGKQTISYHLEAVSETETHITYRQMLEQTTPLQKANDFLIGLLFKKGLKRQIEAQLGALVNYAQSQTCI